MKMRCERSVWLAAIVAAVGWFNLARAEEPKCECQNKGYVEVQPPILSRLPLIGPLFHVELPKLGGPCCAEEVDQLVLDQRLSAEEAQRFGLFFDATNGPPARGVVIVKRFELGNCEGTAPCGASARTGESACSADACQLAGHVAATVKCDGESCCCEAAAAQAAGHKVAKSGCPCQQVAIEHILKMSGERAELLAEKAGLAAALEAQDQLMEAKDEMFERVASLIAENVKLEAKVAHAAEQHGLAEKLQALAVENAKLKAQVELASHHGELEHRSRALAVENERLKLRIAQLEEQSATDNAARTSRRNQAGKKAR